MINTLVVLDEKALFEESIKKLLRYLGKLGITQVFLINRETDWVLGEFLGYEQSRLASEDSRLKIIRKVKQKELNRITGEFSIDVVYVINPKKITFLQIFSGIKLPVVVSFFENSNLIQNLIDKKISLSQFKIDVVTSELTLKSLVDLLRDQKRTYIELNLFTRENTEIEYFKLFYLLNLVTGR